MAVELRLPSISGSDREQLSQIRSYLYQIIPQLEFAINNINSSGSAAQTSIVASRIPSKPISGESAQSSFNAIKSLIIKSADIVNAYYEEINKKLAGVYVAQSDFGTYTEETAQTITENSTAIERAFTNIQTIDTDIQGVFADVEAVGTKLSGEVSGIKQNVENTAKALSDSISETERELSENIDGVSKKLSDQIENLAKNIDVILTVNAYIKSGLLYYNGEGLPVYGLEVGQTNNVNGEDVFKKFARFTADRLSFYDQNDTEVAYISDYKLYITSVEILNSLTGGGFLLDFSRGWTLRYAGGE